MAVEINVESLLRMDILLAFACILLGILALYLNMLYTNRKLQARANQVALNPSQKLKFPLVAKMLVSHNTRIFRFGLPTPTMRLGLPVGKHVFLSATVNNELVSRPYTPVSSDDELGYFDLLIKVYENGKMSSYLDSLQLQQTVDVRGPMGKLTYLGMGKFHIKDSERQKQHFAVKQIAMVAGGTGITPMLQIIRAVQKNKNDTTKIKLIFGNITEADILRQEELDELQAGSPNFRVYYTLDKAPEHWTQGRGYVTKAMLKEQLPAPSDDVLVCLCGPPPMIASVMSSLIELGYSSEMMFKF